MRNFKVKFRVNGISSEMTVAALGASDAIKLVQSMYQNANISIDSCYQV